ncbi:MAG: hypothetical protein HC842_03230 [Cytophagales bacterium]|nr:hypothetical protein [Cytophagales bacterium]
MIGAGYTSTGTLIELELNDCYNALITNNVIHVSNYTASNGRAALEVGSGSIVKNNLFLGNGSNYDYAFDVVENSTISNNIFYGCSPNYRNRVGSFTRNSTFKNNISFGSSATDGNLFPEGNGNRLENNLVNINPQLENVPLSDDWSFEFDLSLQATSPALAAGTDGKDIGPTGSSIPFDPTGVPLPLIQTFDTDEIVKKGDDLSISIKARGKN